MAAVHWQSADGRIVLWQGDCREVMAGLADKSIDHVITDPPYSEHVHAKGRKGASLTVNKGNQRKILATERDLGFASLTPEMLATCAEHFARLARRWSLVFSDVESCHLWRAAMVETGRGRGADPSYEYQMLQEERDAFGKPGNRTQVFIERDLQPGAGFRKIDK